MPGRPRRLALDFVRYGLPAVVILIGLVILVAGGGEDVALEGASLFVGAGLAILLLNLLFRIGVQGDRDRDREDRARAFFDEHGHWPDERRR
ncbi:MAG: hypothetical protein ACM3UV_06410 [Nocardioidaceae bacterium]